MLYNAFESVRHPKSAHLRGPSTNGGFKGAVWAPASSPAIALVLDSRKTFDSAEYGEDNFNFATYVSRSNAESFRLQGLRLLTSDSAPGPCWDSAARPPL